ncbi:uncharacterized protein PFLUO_LOCUS9264 [Penicillium psychrofluorescens]|uniref:uncharacterized protein n=1 Tax=Penicillium psychrofluorescens TaxID=3158075 RepID=UPI003CCE0B25
MAVINKRYCDSYGYCYSSWDSWGRWVAFAVIVGCAFLIFFIFMCFSARRRRTHGLRPYAGTAWMAPPPGPPPPDQPGYQQPYYGGDPYYPATGGAPPPQYEANPQSYGYFGSQPQQQGIELQSPPHAYANRADQPYEPPAGPPPSKA